MSAASTKCPHCFAVVSIPDGAESVACPSCEHVIRPDAPRAARRVRTVSVARSRNDHDGERPKQKRSPLPVMLIVGGMLGVLVVGGAAAVMGCRRNLAISRRRDFARRVRALLVASAV